MAFSASCGWRTGLVFQRLKRGFVALALLAVLAAPGQSAADPEGPEAQIDRFHATLLRVMKEAEKLGFEGRQKALAPVLRETYSFPVMARIAVGAYWAGLDEDQRRTLVDVFARMTVATYASRFDGWSGESFETRGVDDFRPKMVMVRTAIVRPDGDDVAIRYLMRQYADGWRVIDVFLGGSYSEIATRRSEYTSIISRRGFPELIRQIESKIAEQARG